ncbi:lipocalin family protein [uncultured Dokdonia sp.]|uniref:lipocalin family protein n=1 Tax=uncultured Dokdonia sp. TaxID=575653 RepID=UPI002612DF99|nr:lipocalin family protein [uncultured Dokdonia sp.]
MQKLIVCLVIFLFTTSCTNEKSTPFEVSSDIKKLIAGDSLKTWKLAKRYNGKTRMNMGDCFLHYRQSFYSNGTVTDNNAQNPSCGPSLSGTWSVITDSLGYTHIRITSVKLKELLHIDEDYKDFRIFYASKDSLHLSYTHKQFGEKRRISDYLVSEELSIPDRKFHH